MEFDAAVCVAIAKEEDLEDAERTGFLAAAAAAAPATNGQEDSDTKPAEEEAKEEEKSGENSDEEKSGAAAVDVILGENSDDDEAKSPAEVIESEDAEKSAVIRIESDEEEKSSAVMESEDEKTEDEEANHHHNADAAVAGESELDDSGTTVAAELQSQSTPAAEFEDDQPSNSAAIIKNNNPANRITIPSDAAAEIVSRCINLLVADVDDDVPPPMDQSAAVDNHCDPSNAEKISMNSDLLESQSFAAEIITIVQSTTNDNPAAADQLHPQSSIEFTGATAAEGDGDQLPSVIIESDENRSIINKLSCDSNSPTSADRIIDPQLEIDDRNPSTDVPTDANADGLTELIMASSDHLPITSATVRAVQQVTEFSDRSVINISIGHTDTDGLPQVKDDSSDHSPINSVPASASCSSIVQINKTSQSLNGAPAYPLMIPVSNVDVIDSKNPAAIRNRSGSPMDRLLTVGSTIKNRKLTRRRSSPVAAIITTAMDSAPLVISRNQSPIAELNMNCNNMSHNATRSSRNATHNQREAIISGGSSSNKNNIRIPAKSSPTADPFKENAAPPGADYLIHSNAALANYHDPSPINKNGGWIKAVAAKQNGSRSSAESKLLASINYGTNYKVREQPAVAAALKKLSISQVKSKNVVHPSQATAISIATGGANHKVMVKQNEGAGAWANAKANYGCSKAKVKAASSIRMDHHENGGKGEERANSNKEWRDDQGWDLKNVGRVEEADANGGGNNGGAANRCRAAGRSSTESSPCLRQ